MEPLKTTLCYLVCGDAVLMLLRNKKDVDPNAGKWVGVGGKFAPGEAPEDCLAREVREETGWELAGAEFCGIIRFENDAWPTEDMYLYRARPAGVEPDEEGRLPVPACDEGTFAWVPVDEVANLNLWEGDRLFLFPLLRGEQNLDMTVIYHGDELVRVER